MKAHVTLGALGSHLKTPEFYFDVWINQQRASSEQKDLMLPVGSVAIWDSTGCIQSCVFRTDCIPAANNLRRITTFHKPAHLTAGSLHRIILEVFCFVFIGKNDIEFILKVTKKKSWLAHHLDSPGHIYSLSVRRRVFCLLMSTVYCLHVCKTIWGKFGAIQIKLEWNWINVGGDNTCRKSWSIKSKNEAAAQNWNMNSNINQVQY